MLCSTSTGKSGTKWLDRLRSSKGFPAGNDLDLEQFLNHHNPDLSNSPDTEHPDANIGPNLKSKSAESNEKSVLDCKQTTETPTGNGEKEWFGIMSNVIAELFNMGDSNDLPRIHERKSSRKQRNPKICVISTSSNVENESDDRGRDGGVSPTLPSSGDSSYVETKQTSDLLRLTKEENVVVDIDVGFVDMEEDAKTHADLPAFSRTDVTVIDTSYPSWKHAKLLFRRNNVWRVREKKSMSTNTGLKKRKATLLEDENGGEEKKQKLCSSSKNANREQCTMPSNEGHLQSGKMSKDPKETPEILRFSKKPKRGGSSVVLIKSIPASKKNGAKIPKSCQKVN